MRERKIRMNRNNDEQTLKSIDYYSKRVRELYNILYHSNTHHARIVCRCASKAPAHDTNELIISFVIERSAANDIIILRMKRKSTRMMRSIHTLTHSIIHTFLFNIATYESPWHESLPSSLTQSILLVMSFAS